MLIETHRITLEVHRRGLFIRLGQYDMSWDSNGLCFCKGMKTLWANWE
jgi:hypothetical protein